MPIDMEAINWRSSLSPEICDIASHWEISKDFQNKVDILIQREASSFKLNMDLMKIESSRYIPYSTRKYYVTMENIYLKWNDPIERIDQTYDTDKTLTPTINEMHFKKLVLEDSQ